MAEEQAHLEAGHVDGGVEEVEGVPPQIIATPGMPERKAVGRRQARVRENLHLLPKDAQKAILESLEANGDQSVTTTTPQRPAPRRGRRHRIHPHPTRVLRQHGAPPPDGHMPRSRLWCADRVRPWAFGGLTSAIVRRLRQRVIRMTRNPALSVATITPLVLACAVSGVARRCPSAHNGFAPCRHCFGGGCRSRRESAVRAGRGRSRAAAGQRTYRGGHQVGSAAGRGGEFV